jgi:hypothetical protein
MLAVHARKHDGLASFSRRPAKFAWRPTMGLDAGSCDEEAVGEDDEDSVTSERLDHRVSG